MFRSRPGLLIVALAGVPLVLGCSEEVIVPPDPTPPDLTGTYTIQSFTSALDSATTLVPPDVSGSFVVQQTAVGGGEASGTFTTDLKLPFSGNIIELPGSGTYTNRLDGTWEQEFLTGPLVALSPQQTGTYTYESSILTVVVLQPPLSASTTVWRRQ